MDDGIGPIIEQPLLIHRKLDDDMIVDQGSNIEPPTVAPNSIPIPAEAVWLGDDWRDYSSLIANGVVPGPQQRPDQLSRLRKGSILGGSLR